MLSDTLRGGDTKKIIDDLKSACSGARQKYIHDRWRPALRRLPGFLEQDVDTITDFNVDSPQQQVVTTINLCYRNYLGFLAQALPRLRNLQGVAASREAKDLRSAFAAERAVQAEMFGHRGAFVDEILRMVSFVYCCHTASVIVEGVVKKGEKFGEVRVKAYAPLDCFWYPGVRRMEDSPVVVLQELMTREEIESRWADLPKGASGAAWEADHAMQAIQPEVEQAMYRVSRVFIKPSNDYPHGAARVVVEGQDTPIWKSMNKEDKETIGTPDEAYPVVTVGDVPCGYLDFGESHMNLMQGPQRMYNIAYSRFVQAVKENPVYALFSPMGTGVNPEKWTNKTTAFIDYTPVPGNHPQLTPTPAPQAPVDLMQLCEDRINNLVSSHPVSRGQSQGSRMPVGTVQSLVERAQDQNSPLIERLKEGVSVIGERIIIEGQNVWDEKKVFLVVGSHRKYEAIEFEKANLSDGFTLRIRPEDGMPKTMTERWEKVVKGVQAGMFGPTEDPATGERARKLLQILDEDEEFALGHVDEQRAYDDFLTIKEGGEVRVSDFDNHKVHIRAEREYAVEEMTAIGGPLPEEFENALREHQESHALAQQRVNALDMALSQMPTPPSAEGAPAAEGIPPIPGGQPPPQMPMGSPQSGMVQLPG